MRQYRPILISDKPLFDSFFQAGRERSCDCSFTNIFSWQGYFQTTFAHDRNHLVVRFRDQHGRHSYMMPLGRQPDHKDLPQLMQELAREADREGEPLVLRGVTRRQFERLDALCPDTYIYRPMREDFDYLYRSAHLIDLKGKKYQPKRNHLHKLASLPGCEYRPLGRADFDECLVMTQAVPEELAAIHLALEHYETLGLQGGVLRLDGQVVAYTYGQPLSDDTFGVHIEKARPDIEGAYPLINQRFALQAAAPYRYINREEDLGLPGLRQAKLSYHPTELLEKGEVWLASQYPYQDPAPEIHEADESMTVEIRTLWQTCFHDDEDWLDNYFHEYYRPSQTLIMTGQGRVLSALQMLPRKGLVYLSGLSTQPECRRRGYMSRLLQAALERIDRSGQLCVLIPQNDTLIGYYQSFGFQVTARQDFASIATNHSEIEEVCLSLAQDFADIPSQAVFMIRKK
ncbi:MAG: GNAT family N-acetyltransferase [Bacteroidales bacterium]|nr:GNAT family N-acetyltransferase [Bacteroidales bacterium]